MAANAPPTRETGEKFILAFQVFNPEYTFMSNFIDRKHRSVTQVKNKINDETYEYPCQDFPYMSVIFSFSHQHYYLVTHHINLYSLVKTLQPSNHTVAQHREIYTKLVSYGTHLSGFYKYTLDNNLEHSIKMKVFATYINLPETYPTWDYHPLGLFRRDGHFECISQMYTEKKLNTPCALIDMHATKNGGTTLIVSRQKKIIDSVIESLELSKNINIPFSTLGMKHQPDKFLEYVYKMFPHNKVFGCRYFTIVHKMNPNNPAHEVTELGEVGDDYYKFKINHCKFAIEKSAFTHLFQKRRMELISSRIVKRITSSHAGGAARRNHPSLAAKLVT